MFFGSAWQAEKELACKLAASWCSDSITTKKEKEEMQLRPVYEVCKCLIHVELVFSTNFANGREV